MDDEYVVLPLHFTADQCAEARQLLGWSPERLASAAGVSVAAIRAYETGERELLEVTRQALAYRLEQEGLVFFPGYGPLWGVNVRGATPDPRLRGDFALVE